MASSSDNKPNLGLASCLSNVFKLAEVEGLKWIRYVGPNSMTLEAPKSDPVLTSYAKLLSEGYACSWRRLSPSTDGVSGESKDLWIFYFTILPDLSGKLASELKEERSGSWEDGMSPESSAMLFRALNSLIERSLLSENFLPLGKWYARPDPTMGSDGRGCFLCNFSFFIHAHLFICASVDVRAGPALQPLQAIHLRQALASSSGMQVILSPSGLNAIMTGHSYRVTDPGIDDLLDEWKLFYPRRFEIDKPSQLPAAVEVVLGGVRLRYPSQFVFVYHTEEGVQTPPPSPLDEGMMEKVIQGGWEDTKCFDPLVQQKQCEECHCTQKLSSRDSYHSVLTKPSRPHRLLSSGMDSLSERSPRPHRYRPYNAGISHPTDNATPMREHPTPSSLSLSTPMLSTRRRRLGPPKYTTPLSSPAVTVPSSPALKLPGHVPLPPPPILSSVPTISHQQGISPGPGSGKAKNIYDISRVADIMKSSSLEMEKSFFQYLSFDNGWWECIHLPESIYSLQRLVQPLGTLRVPHGNPLMSLPGIASSPQGSVSFPSPGGKKVLSPISRSKSNQSINDTINSGDQKLARKRANSGKGPRGGHTKIQRRESEVAPPASILDPRRTVQDGAEIDAAHIIVQENTQEGMNELNGGGLDGMSNVTSKSSLKPGSGGNLDLTSASAVKIQNYIGSLFDDSEDEEELHVHPSTMSVMETDVFKSNGKSSKPLVPESVHPLDFSHIYPTPPSVESAEEKFEDGKIIGTTVLSGVNFSEEKNELLEQHLMIKLSPLEDVVSEIIPEDFLPLSNLTSNTLPSAMKYYPQQTPKTSSTNRTAYLNKTSVSQSSSSRSIESEPQKFIFPPPSSLVNRQNLTLPLATDHTISPVFPTPYTSLPSSSPLRVPGRFPRHIPSSSIQTPLESPFDPITPTPMSSSRLVPILPEAHALYINLALLDSALGANVSDSVNIDMTAIHNIMRSRSSYRQRLDSISSIAGMGSTSTLIGGGGNSFEEDDLFRLEEEKPLMMLGIADYPSLGFREDFMNTPTPGVTDDWCLNFGLGSSDDDDDTYHKTSQLFLSFVQDYCLHLCLTGKQESSSLSSPSGTLQPYQQQTSNKQQSKDTCRLYHTQSVSSAIMCGKQLILSGSSLTRIPHPPSSAGIKQSPASVTLDKEDNSAAWILDLLSLPTKFITKKLKELKTVFQSSFHHAPCIKVSTKGPLSLRDLQTLTPSQTPAGDDCIPLPMQPIVVGYDHEWMSVSPFTVLTWDKLLLEPFSSQKHILYLVLSPGGDTFTDTLRTFFQNLSIAYKNCKLGVHIPLDKGTWEQGIITNLEKSTETEEDNEEKKTKPEQSDRTSSLSLERICKEMIGPYITKLPTKRDDLLECSSLVNETHPPKSLPIQCEIPTCIVIYVVMKGAGQEGTKVEREDEHPVSQEVLDVMRVFSSVLAKEDIPEETRNRLVIQPLEESELIGPHSNTIQHLRSLSFSVFSRCRPVVSLTTDAHHLTGFGSIVERPIPSYPVRLYSPLYILSPDPPLLPNPLSSHTQPSSSILFASDECTLNCAYCVSADQRWLLAVVCDRQAELLDTCVIGLQTNDVDGAGCRQALQKLWAYLISVMATSVLKWNLVITRLGKPSTSEIREWPQIIYNDGLMGANQLLNRDCETCAFSSTNPSIKNVILVSIQPERNIQLFPLTERGPSISHILVLPPHPSTIAAMTPIDVTAGVTFEDLIKETGNDDTDPLLAGIVGDDVFKGLEDWGGLETQQSTFGTIPGAENVSAPLATGYLISTTPPGYLPSEFWGHEKPQSVCNMFKTLLHCHLSVNPYPGSPPDVLCSVLLSFDALSWLSINHVTQQRNSSLPIHLFLLSKLYNFFSLLSHPR